MTDIAPGRDNPRNSEGAFLTVEDGLLFVYSRFTGSHAEDYTSADLAAIRSRDGENWSEPTIIVRASEEGAMNVMSLSLLRMRDGAIGLFYLSRKRWTDMPVYLRLSRNEGRIWSEARRVTRPERYVVMNNDRVVRLSTGRILISLAWHDNRMIGDRLDFAPAKTVFVYSDDDGLTWRESPQVLALPGSASGLQEPGLVELRSGRLYGFARTDKGMQYTFFSEDGGESWTAPAPSAFLSPLSPLSMKRMCDGRLLAIWNPYKDWEPVTFGRTTLVWAVSADEGASWSDPEVLEADAGAGFCYTAILPQKHRILLSYCAGSEKDGSCLNRLRIREMAIPE